MFRPALLARRPYVPKGFGISPFSMFLIHSTGTKGIKKRPMFLVNEYKSLSPAKRQSLLEAAARHPSFKATPRKRYNTFVRTRFPLLYGNAGERMRKIGKEWTVKRRRMMEASRTLQ